MVATEAEAVRALGLDPPSEAATGSHATPRRPHLDHVDAIRPVKQFAVVSTHSILFFAPAASFGAGAALMVLHVSREAFLFVSACMLTYANADVARIDVRRFYRRRALAVGLPYLCWTAIYWADGLRLPLGPLSGDAAALGHLLVTGYYQLYYLLVIAEFYLLFPLVARLVAATRGHHGALLAVTAAVQVTMVSLIHWDVLPVWMQGQFANREITSYPLYLIGGCLAAVHLRDVDRWLRAHAVAVVASTVAAALVAEGWYAATFHQVGMTRASDAFQPVVVPFNVGAILSLYLLGRVLVDARRPARFRLLVRCGSDSSYGVFLGHMLVITALVRLDWGSLSRSVPWPAVVVGATVVAFASTALVTLALNRTPLSRALTGQPRQRSARRPVGPAPATAAA